MRSLNYDANLKKAKEDAELRKIFDELTHEELREFMQYHKKKALDHITMLQITGGLHAH